MGMEIKYSGPDTSSQMVFMRLDGVPAAPAGPYYPKCDPTAAMADDSAFTMCVFRSEVWLGSTPNLAAADDGKSRLYYVGRAKVPVVDMHDLRDFRRASSPPPTHTHTPPPPHPIQTPNPSPTSPPPPTTTTTPTIPTTPHHHHYRTTAHVPPPSVRSCPSLLFLSLGVTLGPFAGVPRKPPGGGRGVSGCGGQVVRAGDAAVPATAALQRQRGAALHHARGGGQVVRGGDAAFGLRVGHLRPPQDRQGRLLHPLYLLRRRVPIPPPHTQTHTSGHAHARTHIPRRAP